MRWMSRLVLLSAFTALTAGVGLLFVGATVEGVRFTGLLVVVGGIALLVHWAKVTGHPAEKKRSSNERQHESSEIPRSDAKRRSIRRILMGGGFLVVGIGLIQGVSGQVPPRGTSQSIDEPRAAWFVGGCLIAIGIATVTAMALTGILRSSESGRPTKQTIR